jgi:hypothetical protein
MMRVLIAYECSGVVRDAFRARGHDAYSCDLKMSETPSHHHLTGDVLTALTLQGVAFEHFDLVIAHPPCTYLSSSGLHWNNRRPERAKQTEDAVFHVRQLIDTVQRTMPVMRLAIENPVGKLSSAIRKPDQIIQPYQFGDDASKATCLWLWGLPPLRPTGFVEPRLVCCGAVLPQGVGKYGCQTCNGDRVAKLRWANQTDSGQNRLGPSPERAANRARTYPRIAAAMAEQWGDAALGRGEG